MKMNVSICAATLALSVTAGLSHAATLTESFDDPFPNWENEWFAMNSSVQNYYGVGADRGNQPNGLWVDDDIADNMVNVVFDVPFGQTLTSLSIDVATFVSNNVMTIYDSVGDILGQFDSFQTNSFSDTVTYDVTSQTGIGGFSFSASDTRGNTWIDNVTVETGMIVAPAPAPVPLPSSIALLAAGLGGLALRRKRAA